jgi:sigma-E factor negative regulatory protein RseA
MTMSKETREHLSALVDGEISPDTSRFLVKRLGNDDELRATWTRYHLVRDCLRHQDSAIAGDDLCARVSEAIENEPLEIRRRPLSRRWLKPVTGMAIAASVALMAITTVGPGMLGTSLTDDKLAEGSKAPQFTSPQSLTPAPVVTQVSSAGARTVSDRRMDAYLLRHYQATGATSGKGFVTFVPMVITNSNGDDETDQSSADADTPAEKEEDSGSR